MFKAIEREETLTRRVTEQVEQLILDDLLRPGDKLPAERDLAERFQVSRTVIREAIRSLAARGLVEVRQGKGTTVSAPSIESLTQPLALLLRTNQKDLDHKKVLEVRRTLEIEIAGIAAERRTSTNLDELEHLLEDRSATISSRQEFVEWDVAFHSALARATQNELFSLLLDSVATVMRKVREIGFDVPGTPDRAYKFHRKILDCVTAGNAARARRAMQEHLAESEQTILKAMSIQTRKKGSRNSAAKLV